MFHLLRDERPDALRQESGEASWQTGFWWKAFSWNLHSATPQALVSITDGTSTVWHGRTIHDPLTLAGKVESLLGKTSLPGQ